MTNEAKRSKTKRNEAKKDVQIYQVKLQNEAKRSETKQNEAKRSKTKRNEAKRSNKKMCADVAPTRALTNIPGEPLNGCGRAAVWFRITLGPLCWVAWLFQDLPGAPVALILLLVHCDLAGDPWLWHGHRSEFQGCSVALVLYGSGAALPDSLWCCICSCNKGNHAWLYCMVSWRHEILSLFLCSVAASISSQLTVVIL